MVKLPMVSLAKLRTYLKQNVGWNQHTRVVPKYRDKFYIVEKKKKKISIRGIIYNFQENIYTNGDTVSIIPEQHTIDRHKCQRQLYDLSDVSDFLLTERCLFWYIW